MVTESPAVLWDLRRRGCADGPSSPRAAWRRVPRPPLSDRQGGRGWGRGCHPEPPSETKQPVPGLAATSVCPLLLGTRPRPGPLRRASERDVPVSGASRDDPLRANGSPGGLWGGRLGSADCPSASLPLRLSRAPKPKVKAGGGVRGNPSLGGAERGRNHVTSASLPLCKGASGHLAGSSWLANPQVRTPWRPAPLKTHEWESWGAPRRPESARV